MESRNELLQKLVRLMAARRSIHLACELRAQKLMIEHEHYAQTFAVFLYAGLSKQQCYAAILEMEYIIKPFVTSGWTQEEIMESIRQSASMH